MTSVEKKKKKKSKKGKAKKADSKKVETKKAAESDVLERVMDSIEMAGASLEFFEDAAPETPVEVIEEPEAITEEDELDVALSDFDGDTTAEEVLESVVERVSEDLTDAENMDMLATDEENSAEFIEQKQAFSIIESLLFSSDRPMGMGTFKQVFKGTNLKTKEIKKALEELQIEYADGARGVSLEEINGGWQLRTKVDNMDYLRKLAKARPFRLSGPALEVLAIMAYKQPLIKSEVDDIRGVESGHLVRALMEKGLVCFQGKSELPGKPMQYGTTRKFLEIFGLRNLRELPSLDEIDQLLPDGIGIEEEDEKLSDVTDKMSEEFSGNYSEGEEELVKIEATLGDIETSSDFFEEEKIRQREKRDRDRAQDIREALDVGEEVESKDQRWLTRYDEKIAEALIAKEAKENEVVEPVAESEVEMTEEDGERIEMASDVEIENLEEESGTVEMTADEKAEMNTLLADSSEVIEIEEVTEPLIEEAASLSGELSGLTEESTLIPPEIMVADSDQDDEDDQLDGEKLLEEAAEENFEEIQGAESFDPFSEDDDE